MPILITNASIWWLLRSPPVVSGWKRQRRVFWRWIQPSQESCSRIAIPTTGHTSQAEYSDYFFDRIYIHFDSNGEWSAQDSIADNRYGECFGLVDQYTYSLCGSRARRVHYISVIVTTPQRNISPRMRIDAMSYRLRAHGYARRQRNGADLNIIVRRCYRRAYRSYLYYGHRPIVSRQMCMRPYLKNDGEFLAIGILMSRWYTTVTICLIILAYFTIGMIRKKGIESLRCRSMPISPLVDNRAILSAGRKGILSAYYRDYGTGKVIERHMSWLIRVYSSSMTKWDRENSWRIDVLPLSSSIICFYRRTRYRWIWKRLRERWHIYKQKIYAWCSPQ